MTALMLVEFVLGWICLQAKGNPIAAIAYPVALLCFSFGLLDAYMSYGWLGVLVGAVFVGFAWYKS